MNRHRTTYALLLGNFITGSAVLAPAAMLGEIARHFHIDAASAGHLMSFGAVVLCIGSPAMTWLTARVDRRTLLAGAIAAVALGELAAAAATSWEALLAVRLAAMAVAAIFTPQAAGTLALLVPERERATAIATAFLGWSLALALGVPLVSMVAAGAGWRYAHAALGVLGALAAAILWTALPAGLAEAPLPLASWKAIAGAAAMRRILAVTILASAGQFLLFTYLKPVFAALAASGPARTTADLAVFGAMSIAGNLIATRAVGRIGPLNATLASLAAICAGMLALAAGIGVPAVATAGLAVWGLGFAAVNSMQQARLAGAAPALSGASIALNTSSIYIGQAVGAAAGGAMMSRHLLPAMFLVAAALVGTGFAAALAGRRRTA